ncbi:MAG: rod shape-determining protein MreC [Candidatus Jorgensenbacteria bacterium]
MRRTIDMRSLRAILGIGAGVLVIVFLVVFRIEITSALGRFRAALSAAADPAFSYQAFQGLERENEELKARLVERALPGDNPHSLTSLTARVYSRYPVGSGGRLTVNAGSEDGIREGMPVLLSPGTLLGKVVGVRRTQSEVLTIWSPDWKSAVSVASGGPKALLQGGSEPRLELVSKDAHLTDGAGAVNISPEFPLDLLVGTVGAPLADSPNNPWSSYRLVPPVGEAELDSVLVVLNFP